jgi:hypothetical protein
MGFLTYELCRNSRVIQRRRLAKGFADEKEKVEKEKGPEKKEKEGWYVLSFLFLHEYQDLAFVRDAL